MEYFFEGIGCISTYTIIIKTTFLSGFKKDLKEVPKSFRTFFVGWIIGGRCVRYVHLVRAIVVVPL